MKKRIYMMAILFIAGICIGCGKGGTEGNALSTESKASQIEEPSTPANRENQDIEFHDQLKMDFTYDFSW